MARQSHVKGFLLLAALALPAQTVLARENPSAPDTAMDAILSSGETRPLAALAAIKLHDGKILYSYEAGFARLATSDNDTFPVNGQTLFRIASVSKVVTTIGLMELVEQGRVSLDHDVSDYLGFRLRNPEFPETPITLRMLLSHTSGLVDGDTYTLPPDQTVASFFDATHRPGAANYHFATAPAHRPGTWYAYCNLGFGLVGTIIERVSGERFDHYQQAHVLTPLRIEGGYNPSELAHPERLATLYGHLKSGYDPEVDTMPIKGWNPQALAAYRPGTNGTLFSPQGGLRISVTGLSRLARFFQGRGELDGIRILSADSIGMMEAPQWRYDGHNGAVPYPIASYGLGLVFLNGARDPSGRPTIPWQGYTGQLHGHLGDAYDLHSGLWYDSHNGDAYVFIAAGFPGDRPPVHGKYSSFTRVEEKIFTTLSGVHE